MARTPKVINVGKSYLVYEGEEYRLKGERVLKHVRDRSLPARKEKDVGRVVAVYSEILRNDLTVDYRRQMMDRAEIDRFLAKAKARKRKVSEASLRQAAKAEAILKTEFHSLDATEPAANPLLKTRDLKPGKLFIFLSPINLYTQAALLWTLLGKDTSGWPVSASELLPVWIVLLALYAVAVLHALYWLFSVSDEIESNRDVKLRIPSVWYYVLALALPIGGWLAREIFETEASEGITTFIYVAAIALGVVVWLVFIVRFFQYLGRLIGQPLSRSIFPALPFILLPPLAHVSILYFQKRLNILDKNKMNFLVA